MKSFCTFVSSFDAPILFLHFSSLRWFPEDIIIVDCSSYENENDRHCYFTAMALLVFYSLTSFCRNERALFPMTDVGSYNRLNTGFISWTHISLFRRVPEYVVSPFSDYRVSMWLYDLESERPRLHSRMGGGDESTPVFCGALDIYREHAIVRRDVQLIKENSR